MNIEDNENFGDAKDRIVELLKDFVFIPRKGKDDSKIPCLLLTHIWSKKLIIYLHGNGEDLMMCSSQL